MYKQHYSIGKYLDAGLTPILSAGCNDEWEVEFAIYAIRFAVGPNTSTPIKRTHASGMWPVMKDLNALCKFRMNV